MKLTDDEKKGLYTHIKRDHQQVKVCIKLQVWMQYELICWCAQDLFQRFTKTTDQKDQKALKAEIVKLLSVHASIEERVVYPSMNEQNPHGLPIIIAHCR